jgi:hypothetical protein
VTAIPTMSPMEDLVPKPDLPTVRKVLEVLRDVLDEKTFPLLHTEIVQKVTALLEDQDMTWAARLVILQHLMVMMKNVAVSGPIKKQLVIQLFKVLTQELIGSSPTDQHAMEAWVDNDGLLIIDQFVSLAPKLFKKSNFKRVAVWLKQNCRCCFMDRSLTS